MGRKHYPSDDAHNSARARKRSEKRAINVALHAATTRGQRLKEAEDAGAVPVGLSGRALRDWCRQELTKLAVAGFFDRDRGDAMKALLASAEAEMAAEVEQGNDEEFNRLPLHMRKRKLAAAERRLAILKARIIEEEKNHGAIDTSVDGTRSLPAGDNEELDDELRREGRVSDHPPR